MTKEIIAKVVALGEYNSGYFEIVINKGREDGVEENNRFLVYELGDEILDPDKDNVSLGRLEIVKGVGKVKHLQDKITTLQSMEKTFKSGSVTKRKNVFFAMSTDIITEQPEEIPLPFKNVKKGDLVRLI